MGLLDTDGQVAPTPCLSGREGIDQMRLLAQLLRDDEAATAVEYAVMLAMVLMAVMAGIGSVSAQTGGMWGGIVNRLRSVGFVP